MHASVENRVAKDINRRALNGAYIYFAAWMIIGGGAGYHQEHPLVFWSVSVSLLVLGLIRIASYFGSEGLRKRNKLVWTSLLYFNVLTPALIISFMFSLSLLSPEHSSIFTYMMMAMFAFISGGTHSFSPDRALSLSYLCCLVLPAFAATIFLSDDNVVLGLLLAIYMVFMAVQVTRLSNEYKQLVEQQHVLKQLTNLDSLTGIANRRYFDNAIDLAWNTHIRTGANLSLLIIDIDHFKRVNDTHGHQIGDEVICLVANTIKKICQRESDTVARIGGEEFAVLIAVSDENDVLRLAEKIRMTIARSPVRVDSQIINITVSVGVGICTPSPDKDKATLFKVADRCLYEAKEQGRDRVIKENY